MSVLCLAESVAKAAIGGKRSRGRRSVAPEWQGETRSHHAQFANKHRDAKPCTRQNQEAPSVPTPNERSARCQDIVRRLRAI